MTTLILDWSDWDGPASGWVTLTRRSWRRDPDTYQVPWQVSLRVEGRAVVDVQAVAGEVVSIRWAPDGVSSRLEHVLVPDDGEHLAHLLERVDPSTLAPDADPSPLWEARLSEVVASIPSDVVSRADLDAALASLPAPEPVVSASHVALDADGTPFFSPGSTSPQLGVDADGTPYLIGA